ncbi:MAG: CehA/McbA family metallohydrolase [Vicinamibacterales bacterium]
MRGTLRTLLIATAAVTAAVALYVGLTLPRRAATLSSGLTSTQILGAYHIHSTRSDGSGSVDAIAAAAERAGLSFIILTDHGDGTRAPDPPTYRHGVLCIDAVELNSAEGHIVALGLTAAAPYPLAGPARDVIDDIHRLGGAAVLAHPDSPKPELRWRGQNQRFDGIEWMNVDAEWRDNSSTQLLSAALHGLLRPAEAMASLFARPVRTLQRWDSAARVRPVFGLAAVDAHARVGWKEDEEPRLHTAVELPSYEALFRTMNQIVQVDQPLSGSAAPDAARLLTAILAGHSYSAISAIASPGRLAFTARVGESAGFAMGDRVPASTAPVTFVAAIANAPLARMTILANGRPVATGLGEVTHVATAAGVYRLEAFYPGSPIPWLVSNPIVIEATAPVFTAGSPDEARSPVPTRLEAMPIDRLRWVVERDQRSAGEVRRADARVEFDFLLGDGAPIGQYAALVTPLDARMGVERIEFLGQASRPLRVSVQVRIPGGRDGERWRQSVYLDETPRRVSLRLQDFERVGPPTSQRPIAVPLHGLLFVVDTVNAAPGSRGTLWISDLTLGVNSAGG